MPPLDRSPASGYEVKTLDFEGKATSTDDDSFVFEGLGGAFLNVDSYGDVIDPGAFDKTIPQFLQNGFIGGINHNWDDPIGAPIEARAEPKGLFLKAELIPTRAGRDAMIQLGRKVGNPPRPVIRKLSIGFRTIRSEWIEDPQALLDYWRGKGYSPTDADLAQMTRSAGFLRILHEVHLYEVSPVAVPANDQAVITDTSAKSLSRPASPSLIRRQEADYIQMCLRMFDLEFNPCP